MDMDKEKAYREALRNYKARIIWLTKQLIERGYCVPDKQSHWECTTINSCVDCWIAASGRAVNKKKQNGKS